MKLAKKIVLMVLPIFFLFVGGCSQQKQNSNANTASTEQTKFYQDLSEKDQKKVSFKFNADKDSGASSSDSTVYGISADVKNETDKTVQFNQAKFLYLNENNKHSSQIDGNIDVKPHSSVHIDQIFTGVSDQEIDGHGAIVYLNEKYRLAYTKFTGNKLAASSTNLTDQGLADQFDKAQANNYGSKSDDSSDSSESSSQPTTKTPSSHQSNGTSHGFGSHSGFVGDYYFYNYDPDRLQSDLTIYSDGTVIQENNDDTSFHGTANISSYSKGGILSYDVTSDSNDTKEVGSDVKIDIKWSNGETETYYGYTSYDGDQVLTDGVSYHDVVNEVWVK